MNREEHLKWCKKRAGEYLDIGDPDQAIASMMSDLSKHDETQGHPAIILMFQLKMMGQLSNVSDVQKYIDGFN